MGKRDPKLFNEEKETKARTIVSTFAGWCKECGMMTNLKDELECPRCGCEEVTDQSPEMKEAPSANKWGGM